MNGNSNVPKDLNYELNFRLTRSRKPLVLLGIGILLMVVFLYAFIDLGKSASIIASVNLTIYSFGFVSVILGIFAYTLAWHFFLTDAGVNIGLIKEFEVVWVSIFLNLLIPTGSVGGEVVRAYIVQNESKVHGCDRPIGDIAASIVAHRILVMVPFLLGSVVGFIYLITAYSVSSLILNLACLATALSAGAFLIACYLLLFPEKVGKLIHSLIRLIYRLPVRSLKKKIEKSQETINRNIEAFSHGLKVAKRKLKIFILSLFFAVLFWVFDVLVAFFVFQALAFPIPLGVLVFVYTIGVMLQMIPIGIPGMVGAVEITMITLYTITGIPLEVATAATILIRVVMFWFEIIVGGLVTYVSLRKIAI